MSNCIVKFKVKEGCDDLTLNKANPDDAGFDLRSSIDIDIKRGEVKGVPLGVCILLEKGYEAQIRPRSGMALKHGLSIKNSPGTIDCGYTGELTAIVSYDSTKDILQYIKTMLSPINSIKKFINKIFKTKFNIAHEDVFHIKRGDRIAQLVVNKIPSVMLIQVNDLGQTQRGGNGFGSTGVK